jgi:hypothetical protein
MAPDRRPLDIVFAVAGVYLGLFWGWAGIAKAFAPTAAYEFAARVVGGGAPAKTVVVASVVLEAFLGLALLVRAVSARAGAAASLVLLIAFSGLLGVAKSAGGGALACGCYAFFATSAASVDRELWINGGHAAILALLLVAARLAGRRAPAAA